MSSALKTSELKSDKVILVVDKIGILGFALASEFSKDYVVVLVSSFLPEENKNIIHIPFKKRIPEVPDDFYSKILLVDDGEAITRKSAFSFINKARDLGSPLFFIGSLRNLDISHADILAKEYSKSKILVFGDLFDKKFIFDKESSISKFILQTKKHKRIEVLENGLSLNYPISFGDTVKLIIRATELEISQKIILLFPPHPVTDITLANTFKRIDPEVKVDFVKQKTKKKLFIPPGGDHAISKYDLVASLKELDLWNPEDKISEVNSKQKKQRKNFLKPILFFILVIVFLSLLPLATTFIYASLGSRELTSAKQSAKSGDFSKAISKANNSLTFFNTAKKTSDFVLLESSFVGQTDLVNKYVKKIDGGIYLSQGEVHIYEGISLMKSIYKNESKDPKGDFSKSTTFIKSGLALFQKASAQDAIPKDLSSALKNLDPFIELVSGSSDLLFSLLGFNEEKKYLIIFQDNQILRPGGGLITSYGILKVKNGNVVEFPIYSSEEIDSKLKAKIEPPFTIRRYMQSEKLYFKDSNFDPDFVASAIRASNIYSLEKEDKVDGVIGVDVNFLKYLLEVLGSVDVENLGKVSSGNLSSSLQSSSNASFLILDSVRSKILNGENYSRLNLAEAIGRSIIQKHLAFAFEDLSSQNIFTANNWSSSLWDNRKEQPKVINDYLALVEFNLGLNKINDYISRSIDKKLIISEDGNVSSDIIIKIKNNKRSDSKSQNVYKTYIQLILPLGSKIDKIQIDKEAVKTRSAITDPRVYEASVFKPPQGLELEEKRESDKSIFGFLISVDANQIKNIVVSYTLPYSISLAGKNAKYSLKIFKQPGVSEYPLSLGFILPPQLDLATNQKTYSKNINSDQEIIFDIVQK